MGRVAVHDSIHVCHAFKSYHSARTELPKQTVEVTPAMLIRLRYHVAHTN